MMDLFVALAFLSAVGILMLLIIAEFAMPKSIRTLFCKYGKHKFVTGAYKKRKHYTCRTCKSPRKHPQMRYVEGGKVELNHFKF